MKYKANKEVTLFNIKDLDGLIASKFEVKVSKAAYDWIKNIVIIELAIKEDGAKFMHVRSFEIPADGEVTSNDVEERVLDYLNTLHEGAWALSTEAIGKE